MPRVKKFTKYSLLLSTLISVAYADQPLNHHFGFYLSGDIGAILSDNFTGGDPNLAQGFDYNGLGLGGAAGYMFNPYVGVEGSVIGSIASGVATPDDLTLYWYGAALKLNIPFYNRFAFFVKGGVGGLYTSYNISGKVTDNSAGALVGGGFGFSMSKNSELSLETNGIIASSRYVTLLGIAYTYHFD